MKRGSRVLSDDMDRKRPATPVFVSGASAPAPNLPSLFSHHHENGEDRYHDARHAQEHPTQGNERGHQRRGRCLSLGSCCSHSHVGEYCTDSGLPPTSNCAAGRWLGGCPLRCRIQFLSPAASVAFLPADHKSSLIPRSTPTPVPHCPRLSFIGTHAIPLLLINLAESHPAMP
jgi:hypothetical protein